ncbi:MAG: AGE family epimerase/isomerase [Cyanosarcina radialis HA8281-LM2]|jgi:mannose/cellobiose epimerase-like protein (N-acyl-D-glucosamine 2-epimerase family)|nr:AGE family epimerase/isomerase [Cyanosarcina radialis HA8281-LM2]
MNKIDFTFSDSIAGYVTRFDRNADAFSLKTADDREYLVHLSVNIYGELVRNLGEAYQDATAQMRDMLVPGRFLFAYGIFYPDGEGGDYKFEAKHLVFVGRTENEYLFEKQNWWIKQVRQLADFYIKSEFGDGEIDYSQYRTNLTLTGDKQKSGRQETDTISRLVYGFASAYLMTGDDRYLEAAQKGTQYLRKHLRFQDKSENICYWYHAVDIKDDGSEQKIFASEFGDDYDAIPCYEQIYALAGPTQTYRITGDPRIFNDIKGTINLFNRYFKDKTEKGGFFSHIDPITFDPHSECLGHNRARKNWNSVGDHAPAYLINLWLATGASEYADFLEYTFDTIAQRFPDYNASPFVQEKFFEDWSKDQSWGWQQNRAVVGHNLKIAWNLMRMNSLKPKTEYSDLATKIAALMPTVGSDRQRCGWYDVVERVLGPGEKFHRYAWHDRKAWWQQEQAILAYLILAGVLKKPEYLRLARESSAFYNVWFLDTESGGVYFNVLANGHPYSLGTERGKGSHSMAGYHSFELAYLAAVYTNLLVNQEPMDFFFKPMSGGFEDNILRVQPDILPPGSVRIDEVWLNGQSYTDFDAAALTIKLPTDLTEMKFRVRIVPAGVNFDADLVELTDGAAKICLSGSLEPSMLKYLKEELEKAHGATSLTLLMQDLQSISPEALRYLAFFKQKAGGNFSISAVGASGQVKEAIDRSELSDEITLVDG